MEKGSQTRRYQQAGPVSAAPCWEGTHLPPWSPGYPHSLLPRREARFQKGIKLA